MRRKIILAIALYLLGNAISFADVLNVQVRDKDLSATVQVASIYTVDLTLKFESVSNLTASALTISAVQLGPADLLNRLTDPSLIAPPNQLPILISIAPSPGSTLSFTGIYTIELSTSNLSFDSSLRLLTAQSGGTFEDITNLSGVGSYRVNGTGGRFSDFVIVADLRNTESVIQLKFDSLQESLNLNAGLIEANMLQSLQSKLNAAKAAYQGGSKTSAVSNVQAMNDQIVADNGTTIPNLYRANDVNTNNVAGDLRRRAATLIFSLKL